MNKLAIAILLVLITLLTNCATYPPGASESHSIRATGYAMLPTNVTNPGHARLVAQREAHTNAIKNLMDRVRDIPIVGKTTAGECMTKSDNTRAQVYEVIHNARIISSRELPDHRFEVELEVHVADLKAACK